MSASTITSTVQINTAEITVLVAPVEQSGMPADVSVAYPVDMDCASEVVTEQLRDICEAELLGEISDLEVVGIEFNDPEQHNTTVTLEHSALGAATWIRGAFTIDGVPAIGQLAHLIGNGSEIAAIAVPAYS